MIDVTSAVGKRALTQLTTEQIVWFTTVGTVGADRLPQPSPVWFLWGGETVLIFSRPNAPKVRNVAQNAHVALHFREDSLVIAATARVSPDPATPEEIAAYVEKYRQGITTLNLTPETFVETYSTVLRVAPMRIRGN